ncbi:hypothetical protein NEOLEDRAFT_1183583 [Neolentinus lepideus HHB14362 ss-1]|uniref:Uncharacterized protein n=1 Tax=Neolentinus lepideus HHB14362 ss-1 TaxID=1314782 RepID=A0A165N574_9AGAM|nr:hypothetical protein NEOLEDRAFT_1183583 [Neolentinus lepideus HHB14362 ss-1]
MYAQPYSYLQGCQDGLAYPYSGAASVNDMMSNEGYPATNTQPHPYMQVQGCQGLGYHSAQSHPYSGAASVNNAYVGQYEGYPVQ